jgi:hypothetical protein
VGSTSPGECEPPRRERPPGPSAQTAETPQPARARWNVAVGGRKGVRSRGHPGLARTPRPRHPNDSPGPASPRCERRWSCRDSGRPPPGLRERGGEGGGLLRVPNVSLDAHPADRVSQSRARGREAGSKTQESAGGVGPRPGPAGPGVPQPLLSRPGGAVNSVAKGRRRAAFTCERCSLSCPERSGGRPSGPATGSSSSSDTAAGRSSSSLTA